jgi:hypothetical protein
VGEYYARAITSAMRAQVINLPSAVTPTTLGMKPGGQVEADNRKLGGLAD